MRSSLGTFRGLPTIIPLGTGLDTRSDMGNRGGEGGFYSPLTEERLVLWFVSKRRETSDTRGFHTGQASAKC